MIFGDRAKDRIKKGREMEQSEVRIISKFGSYMFGGEDVAEGTAGIMAKYIEVKVSKQEECC